MSQNKWFALKQTFLGASKISAEGARFAREPVRRFEPIPRYLPAPSGLNPVGGIKPRLRFFGHFGPQTGNLETAEPFDVRPTLNTCPLDHSSIFPDLGVPRMVFDLRFRVLTVSLRDPYFGFGASTHTLW